MSNTPPHLTSPLDHARDAGPVGMLDMIVRLTEERDALSARVVELERDLASGSFYKESDIDALQSRAERAEAALATARNDALEAAAKVALDRQGRKAMGSGPLNSAYDIGISDAHTAIRALKGGAA